MNNLKLTFCLRWTHLNDYSQGKLNSKYWIYCINLSEQTANYIRTNVRIFVLNINQIRPFVFKFKTPSTTKNYLKKMYKMKIGVMTIKYVNQLNPMKKQSA